MKTEKTIFESTSDGYEPETASGNAAGENGIHGCLEARFVEFGDLLTAKACARFASSAAGMKPKTPVLASTIDFERFTRRSTIRGTFGFGHFKVDDRVIISFRLQSGSVQIFWLADATDPDVWRAIKRLKTWGEAGFALTDGSNAVFIPWKLRSSEGRIEEFSGEARKEKSSDFLDVVSRLIQSGAVHDGATSDIEGVALDYVHVNVLMTKRLERAADVVIPDVPNSHERSGAAPSAFEGRLGGTLH